MLGFGFLLGLVYQGLELYIYNLLCKPFCISSQHNKAVLLLSVDVANASLVNHVNLCSFLHSL